MIGTAIETAKWLLNQSDKEKLYKTEEYTERRTLTQNAYMWTLVNEIANVLNLSKKEVYIDMLRNYSQSMLVTIKANIDVSNFFKYYDEERTAKINGVDFKIYKVYQRSREMNKKEFSILLNGIIQEAQQLGISTLTPQEIAKMRWIENET